MTRCRSTRSLWYPARRLGDRFTATGWMARPFNADSVSFDLGLDAREFHLIGNKRLADLYVTGNVTWKGTDQASSATGTRRCRSRHHRAAGNVGQGTVQHRRLARTRHRQRRRRTTRPPADGPRARFVRGLSAENVSVVMGPDVWLRSQDADIKLTGCGEPHGGARETVQRRPAGTDRRPA